MRHFVTSFRDRRSSTEIEPSPRFVMYSRVASRLT
jgi:hypothetical protein